MKITIFTGLQNELNIRLNFILYYINLYIIKKYQKTLYLLRLIK
jgi:hypothetical protein